MAGEGIGRNKLFGAYVRRRRLQLDWTQEEMAARMRPAITPSYISKLENGSLPDTLSTLLEIARVFGDSLVVVLREAGLVDDADAPLTDAQRSLLAAAEGITDDQLWAMVRFLQSQPATGAETNGRPPAPSGGAVAMSC